MTVTPLGLVPVKGLTAPIDVYELTGAVGAHARFQVSARRGLSRFVGRAPEMETLAIALGEAARGDGQVVGLSGEPGVGKSRLFHEFIHSHHTRGWLVVQAGSVSYGRRPLSPGHRPAEGLLPDRGARRPAAGPREGHGKVLAFDDTLRPMLPALLSLLDVEVEDRRWETLDPSERRRQTHDAVTRTLLRESRVQPAVRGPRGPPLGRRRDPGRARRPGRALARRPHPPPRELSARVPPLVGDAAPLPRATARAAPRRERDRVARCAARRRSEPRSAKQLVIERTAGNPFFVEETVRTLVETGMLDGRQRPVPADGGPREHPGASHGARPSSPLASIGSRSRTRACSRTHP